MLIKTFLYDEPITLSSATLNYVLKKHKNALCITNILQFSCYGLHL